MLDIREIVKNQKEAEENLARRGLQADLSPLVALDAKRRQLLQAAEEKKNIRNAVSKEIGIAKGRGEDPAARMEEMRQLGQEIAELDAAVSQVEEELEKGLLNYPNFLHPSVPAGLDESQNVEVRRIGTPRAFDFQPKDHQDLGVALDIMDFQRGTKVTAGKFVFMKGLGARLERALVNFMLDYHMANGYEEILSPFLVNGDSLLGTGQLPKFGEEMYKVEGTDFYLTPTAEVPLTNMYRDEILREEDLPLRYCGYTPCFRSEAGAAGRDTKGLIRMHQFSKVELVHFVKQEDGDQALEEITGEAEGILQALGLPYRVITLCAGDTGFGSAKTYDIEVWLPSYGTYKEISSCSLYRDFQARRARIRYKSGKSKQLAYTLNGSGLAVGRTIAAILENFQEADGSIRIPEALVPYLGADRLG